MNPTTDAAAASDEQSVADGCLTLAVAARVATDDRRRWRASRSPARRRRPRSACRRRPRVTVIGDSITASFDYVPAARRYLGKGLDLRSDAVVCRRLVATSCSFQGSTPATALEVVGSQRRALGPVVVINVGYNDWAAVYDVDRVMRALKAAGVRTVIWVTLREATSYADVYAQSNARIRNGGEQVEGQPRRRRLERVQPRQAVVPRGRPAPDDVGGAGPRPAPAAARARRRRIVVSG